MKVVRRRISDLLLVALGLIVVIAMLPALTFIDEGVQAVNITNDTVSTRVNVTNTAPEIRLVQVQPNPVDLNPGSTINVTCNGTAFDANGFDDIINVTATLYDTTVGMGFTTDNNFRYRELDCRYNSSHSCSSLNGAANNASCTCDFQVQYYANNGSWQCNMTVSDSFLNGTNLTNFQINTALGIDVPPVIDFGNLSVLEVSADIRENVTNFGNVPLNVSVRGYGGSSETLQTSNLSMVCYAPGSLNISNTFERYSLLSGQAYSTMFNISNVSRTLNISIPVRENDAAHGNATNATFWKLQVPTGVAGFCNGTVIFNALDGSIP